ncbi:hypothetical protein NA57DRAFT_55545 [Rhizodiscina lignyota]|uniref:TAP-C domain-containing protein n=1 Tax=Rhizodiscina lignyota TaxID=1504668 RepID=A0A9P4IGI3_9PEZI|nr:hypothetical protein NA57DRAFT_55545 [Rhizodiscina lignyota]
MAAFTMKRSSQQTPYDHQDAPRSYQYNNYKHARTDRGSDVSMSAAPDRHAEQPLRTLHVSGWRNSKASSNPDGGVAALIAFIERRATISKQKHNTSHGRRQGAPVQIQSHTVNNGTLTIQVVKSDYIATINLSGYDFAGTPITIEADAPKQAEEMEDVEMPDSDPEEDRKEEMRREEMVKRVMEATRMRKEYAVMCLEAGDWDWDKASAIYAEKKDQIPADAFM